MVMMLKKLSVHVSEFEVTFSCQGGKKVIMKFLGSVFMCHPSYKTFQFLGNFCRDVTHLPFPFEFSSWAFGAKFFWIIARIVIEVINGEVLFVLHPSTQLIKLIWRSQLHDCLEDVLKLLLKFLHGFEEGVLHGFTHWCFGNVGMGAHVEVVKRGLYNYVRVRVTEGIQNSNFERNF